MQIFKTFKKADEIIQDRLDSQGHFTREDLELAGFSKRFASFMCFLLKRSNDYDFFYLRPNGQKIEYKYDEPKETRNQLTLCFKPN